MTGMRWLGRRTLAMAARQADRSYLSDVGLFRYFILANREGASNDWALTRLTPVNGEVKVLFSHLESLNMNSFERDAKVGDSDGQRSNDI